MAAFDVTLAENSPAQHKQNMLYQTCADTSVEREMSYRQGCACEVNYSGLVSVPGRIL